MHKIKVGNKQAEQFNETFAENIIENVVNASSQAELKALKH